MAEARLTNARRADEAEDGRFGFRIQLDDRQMFKDALLDVFEVIVILVENLLGLIQIQIVRAALVPGQIQNPFEISANDVIVGRGGGQPLKPFKLAFGFLEHLFRQAGLLDALAQ